MIAIAKQSVADESAHDQFLEMLPSIERAAQRAFRSRRLEEREELIQEVVANAYVAFSRLVELEKLDLAYPTPLAMFAVKQVISGRRVGSRLNVRDVMSPANRRVAVESLERFDHCNDRWQEVLVEDKHVGPAETAAARLDFAKWFRKLPTAKRRVARVLATGETTKATARKCGLSTGRVSQLRRELQASWCELQGEPVAA